MRRVGYPLIQEGAKQPESIKDDRLVALSVIAPTTVPIVILEHDITDAETLPSLRTEAYRLLMGFLKVTARMQRVLHRHVYSVRVEVYPAHPRQALVYANALRYGTLGKIPQNLQY